MRNLKEAFTLAEIMIVLTVIGVLTAILLPTAFHATPNEDVLKFKKANIVVATIVREMSAGGKYYKEGDLRYRPASGGGEPPLVANNYMCQVIADIVSAKNVNCANNNKQTTVYMKQFTASTGTNCNSEAANTFCNLANAKKKLDSICSSITTPKGVTMSDGAILYEAKQTTTLTNPECNDPDDTECNCAYKVLCLKIGSLYFGYGIRSDGKVITSENADDYMEKSIQEED